jgi:hypothetical protein
MIFLFSEIFDKLTLAPNDAERVRILREYTSPGLKEFLNYAFNPSTVFEVTVPKYKPSVDPAGLNLAYLEQEVKKLYIFVKDHPARKGTMSPRKAEQNLHTLLACLHKDEASLLAGVINKTLAVPHLTATLVKQAYPDMPWEVKA